MARRWVVAVAATLLCGLVANAGAAILEVPHDGGEASGIGYFSGWKCPPNYNISIVVDGGAPLPVASAVARGDTAGVCGNDGRNGFIAQINFGLFGDGLHTAVVRQNGVPFAQSTFRVTTFGTTFLSGVSGAYDLPNFPRTGQTTRIDWSQGTQSFIVTATSDVPSPTPTPSASPSAPALVRYRSALQCFFLFLDSTIEANGYSWRSRNGQYTPYQAVYRTTLGPFTETNDQTCVGNNFFPGTFNLTPGHRYALVQTLNSAEAVVLTLADEGLASNAEASNRSGLSSDLPLATEAIEAKETAQPTEMNSLEPGNE